MTEMGAQFQIIEAIAEYVRRAVHVNFRPDTAIRGGLEVTAVVYESGLDFQSATTIGLAILYDAELFIVIV